MNKEHLDPNLEEKIVRMANEVAMSDEAGRRAAAEPLPGAARAAFTLEPDIEVGHYKVRAACDFDLNLLSQLNSKFYDFFMKGGDSDTLPTGPDAWDLCYVMTNEPRAVAKLVKERKLQGLRDAAEYEFAFLQLRDLSQIVLAAVRQVALSCETVTAHKAASQGAEGEAAKSSHPPSGERLTASAG